MVSDRSCEGCFEVNKLPVDLEALRTFYGDNEISYVEDESNREKCERFFCEEVNTCLVSSCNCFSLEFDKDIPWDCVSYKVSSAALESDYQSGCDKCAVEMHTGVLRVNTSVSVGRRNMRPTAGEAKCSLALLWTSKVNNLSVYDKWLQETPYPINTLSIYVDFLPALELFNPKPGGDGYEHDCFLVPKHCQVCARGYWEPIWRKSSCMAEIANVVSEMSEKHRKCIRF